GRTFLFALEAGNHWKTWLSIATFARAAEEAGEERVSVCLRTPELPPIPKPSWKSAEDIHAATRSRLLLLRLDRPRMITLYAAHDLYEDAVQGDIAYEPEQVKDFLRKHLADFWRGILEWRGEAAAGSEEPADNEEPATQGGIDELERQVAMVVQAMRFLSLEDLLARLPAPARQR